MWMKVLIALVVALAASPAAAAMISLSGDITYRERVVLPAGARLRVQLVDTTVSGNPPRVEAEALIGRAGRAPLTFNLNFDDAAIDTTHDYGIVAEISVGPELWFRNRIPFPVTPLEPEGPLLVVTGFVRDQTGSISTGERAAASPILDITWWAESIRGAPVSSGTSTLSIGSDMRAGGKGGCNSYFAQARLTGEVANFNEVTATQAACASDAANAQEQAFFNALAAVNFWQMSGDRLVMFDANGIEVLRFAQTAR